MIARIEAAGEIAMVRVDGSVVASGIGGITHKNWITPVLTAVGPDRQLRHADFRRLVEVPIYPVSADEEEFIQVSRRTLKPFIYLHPLHIQGLWTAQVASIDPVNTDVSLRLRNFQRIPQ